MAWGILSYFRTGPRKDTEAAERPTTTKLFDLPPELVLSVADYLPTSSAACLALCNRRLSRVIGPIAWASLRHQEEADRLTFLCVLAKDLPRHFTCHNCVRLHPSSSVSWPRSVPHRESLHCALWGPAFRYLSSNHYFIRFAHIQLAMKRHYFGSDHGIPLEAFSHTEVELNDRKDTITLFSVDARIVSDELLARSQQWVLLPRGRQDEFLTKELLHHICDHIYLNDTLSNFVRSSLNNQLKDQRKCCARTLQCPKCYMDFSMDAVDFNERGIAMVVTRWINLGAGIDPLDAKWRSHLHLQMPEGVVHQPPPVGSIRASFESQEGQSCEDFSDENILRLFSRRERKMVTRGADGFVWNWRCRGSRWWYLSPSGPVEEVPVELAYFHANRAWLPGISKKG